MKTKLLSFLILFFIGNLTINAQVSLGLKIGSLKAGSGDQWDYSDKSLYDPGYHCAFLFRIDMGKYLGVNLEPGITNRSSIDSKEINLPINCMFIYPFENDKIDIYMKLGIRANFEGNQSNFGPPIVSIKELLKDINQEIEFHDLIMYHSYGMGLNYKFRNSQVILELEQFQWTKNTLITFFGNDDRTFKEVQISVGYLYML